MPDSYEDLTVVRVPADLRLLAAERVVGGAGGAERRAREAAARKFVESAGKLGIDISLMWGTLDPSGRYFHHVCLAVVGAGRTAMLFLSEEDGAGVELELGASDVIRARRTDARSGIGQRRLLLLHACRHLASLRGPMPVRPGGTTGRTLGADERSIILVQGLLETDEAEAALSLEQAGFLRLGDLAYMRRPLAGASSRRLSRQAGTTTWPAGVTVTPMSQVDPAQHDRLLGRALARSYIDTLDCPELCGLRTIDDVLESHRAVGTFDAARWWLVESDGEAEGAMLLSECPEQSLVELVYLGLSPVLRGRGLGAALLRMGLAAVSGGAAASITCAVDTRNAPAMKLYKRAGFQHVSTRVPMVKGLGEQGEHEAV